MTSRWPSARNQPVVGLSQSVEKALARYEDSGAIPKMATLA